MERRASQTFSILTSFSVLSNNSVFAHISSYHNKAHCTLIYMNILTNPDEQEVPLDIEEQC